MNWVWNGRVGRLLLVDFGLVFEVGYLRKVGMDWQSPLA